MKDKNRMGIAIAVLLFASLLNTAVSSTVIENQWNKNFDGINWNEEYEEILITPNSHFFLEKPCVELANNSSVCKVIIQLYDEPVLNYVIEQKAELQIQDKKEINAIAKAYENSISITHLAVKKEIYQNNIGIRFTGEYQNLFNGFAAEVSTEDITEIENISYIKAVFPDQKISVLLTDSVQLINATEVWQIQNASGVNITGKNIKVAIIDTGIDYMHPDLGGGFGPDYKVIDGWDFVNNDPDPMDDNGHGTHVAGVVAANGSIRGIAPDSQLMIYKALDYEGVGYMSDIIASIEKAVDPDSNPFTDDGADIISISSGGIGDPDDPISQAVDNAVDYGVVAIVATGNEGPSSSTILSPGTARKAITVGATNKFDAIAWFSSRGPVVWNGKIVVKPDLVAPGVNINSTVPDGSCSLCSDNGYMILNGTSMATPMVTGTAALLIQMNPHWCPGEIKMALRITAKDLSYDVNTQGYGRIDAYQAVTLDSAPPIAVLDTSGTVKGSINILGTAAGNGFVNYTIEYGTGDGNWHYIGNSDSQVNDDVLVYGWNTTQIDAGKYFLRLTVISTSGLSSEDRTMIYVGSGSVSNLDTGEEFLTIQGAIDAANTSDGHTIIVNPGIYYENVIVTKQLFLRGVEIEGKKPVVDALENGDIITLSTDWITLEGFMVTNSSMGYDGIRVSSNYNTITSNTISNNSGAGIVIGDSSYNAIIDNIVSNSDNGIYVGGSYYNTIKDNTISNRNHGIVLYISSNNNVINNTLVNNGLFLGYNSYNNMVEDNTINSKPLVYLENTSDIVVDIAGQVILLNCNNITVKGLNLSNGSVGIQLVCTNDSIISDNLVCNNHGYDAGGIIFWSSNNNIVTNNNASNNYYYGISIQDSINNTIKGNTANNNDKSGIDILSSNNNTIIDNNASNNYRGGISIVCSINNNVTSNIAKNNHYSGISLHWKSYTNTIKDNTASNNMNGIQISSSSNNIIEGNIASNNYRGITIYDNSIFSSSNNLIYNNFLNNTINAYDDSNNIWNTISRAGINIIGGPYLGGNYWSDYSGEDPDVDGFGDTVYIIPGGLNRDHLPLVYRICGDVDGDMVVNTEDMQLMLDHIFTGAVIRDWAGDVDGSGNINILDMRLLMNHISDQALYPLNCTSVDVDLIISNITAASGKNYILNTLDIDKLQYIDRDYIFNSVPSSYAGLNYIITANLHNVFGISLTSSSNNELTDNTVNTNTIFGIGLSSSSDNTFTDNSISDNKFGIILNSSNNNLIYNNYFSNTVNANDNGDNIWNTTKTSGENIIGGSYLGGNYWSDYIGDDTDGDGIGDTLIPYNKVIGNGGDYLPLI